jgi:hypothetical protein
MKINGKKVTNKGHQTDPYPIVRNIEEEIEVDVLDEDGEPTGEKTTEVQRVEHIYYIIAEPVWTFEDFNTLYPPPTPPTGGWSPKTKEKEPDFKDPQYLQDITDYRQARNGWALLKSLAPSNLEVDIVDDEGEPTGEVVDMKKPKTWPRITAGLQAMFSFYEYNHIIDLIDEACGINEEKIAENRESFLSDPQAPNSVRTKA